MCEARMKNLQLNKSILEVAYSYRCPVFSDLNLLTCELLPSFPHLDKNILFRVCTIFQNVKKIPRYSLALYSAIRSGRSCLFSE